jgi:hypothetical protein
MRAALQLVAGFQPFRYNQLYITPCGAVSHSAALDLENTMRSFSTWIATAALALAVAVVTPCRVRADIVYAVSGAGGSASTLYTLNLNGSVASTVGTVTVGGTGVMVSSIALNPSSGVLYGAAADPVSGIGQLLTINPSTAVATEVGSFGLTPPSTNVASLAFSATGTLYAYSKLGTPAESLFSVNTATGGATPIGASGISSSSGDGMAMNAAGTLYWAGKGATGALYTLNTSTGAATAGPTLSGAPLSLSQIKGLAFDSSGTLYGIDLQPTTFLADLITINPATGVITNLGATPNGLTSLAIAPVPEPGGFTLVGCAVLSGALVARGRRRGVAPEAS